MAKIEIFHNSVNFHHTLYSNPITNSMGSMDENETWPTSGENCSHLLHGKNGPQMAKILPKGQFLLYSVISKVVTTSLGSMYQNKA